eukprot:scaffold4129_cov390-Prasinococcus_capsulatus_cf.AAC.6
MDCRLGVPWGLQGRVHFLEAARESRKGDPSEAISTDPPASLQTDSLYSNGKDASPPEKRASAKAGGFTGTCRQARHGGPEDKRCSENSVDEIVATVSQRFQETRRFLQDMKAGS